MESILTLEDVTKELGLRYFSQDWGIINCDRSRIIEFIDYYSNNEIILKANKAIKYGMLELIIASFNDYLMAKIDDQYTLNRIKVFVSKVANDSDFIIIRNYWLTIKNKLEFPVGYEL